MTRPRPARSSSPSGGSRSLSRMPWPTCSSPFPAYPEYVARARAAVSGYAARFVEATALATVILAAGEAAAELVEARPTARRSSSRCAASPATSSSRAAHEGPAAPVGAVSDTDCSTSLADGVPQHAAERRRDRADLPAGTPRRRRARPTRASPRSDRVPAMTAGRAAAAPARGRVRDRVVALALLAHRAGGATLPGPAAAAGGALALAVAAALAGRQRTPLPSARSSPRQLALHVLFAGAAHEPASIVGCVAHDGAGPSAPAMAACHALAALAVAILLERGERGRSATSRRPRRAGLLRRVPARPRAALRSLRGALGCGATSRARPGGCRPRGRPIDVRAALCGVTRSTSTQEPSMSARTTARGRRALLAIAAGAILPRAPTPTSSPPRPAPGPPSPCPGARAVDRDLQRSRSAPARSWSTTRAASSSAPAPAASTPKNVRRLKTMLKANRRSGRFTVAYTVVSADGHRESGRCAFRLR